MLWQSVVGKLWLTILLLVTVVLTVLMVMLLRFTEDSNLEEAEGRLNSYANMAISIYESHSDVEGTFDYLQTISNEFSINIMVVENGEKIWSATDDAVGEMDPQELVSGWPTDGLQQGERTIKEDSYPLNGSESEETEVMIVGAPLGQGDDSSAIFLYQR